MVTLYDLGISISFIVGNSKISVKNAAESEKDYDSNELTTILFREYENVSLEFTSMSDEDRIYFDGIDLLPAELCEIDDAGDLYLNPQKDEMVYPLFEYSSEYYAMRVGKYELKIYHNGIIYYQWFTVLPKNINGAEWEIMQQELEIEMQGLSTDIIRKNISLGNNKNEVVPSQELYRFFVIKKHFNNILAALIDLKDKPKYKVQKEYRLEPLYRATYIDNVTVKDYLMKGTGEEEYLVPKRIYNYDLPENRWLKKIIGDYENELRIFEESTYKYCEYVNKELSELKKFEDANKAVIRAKEKVLAELDKYLETARTILSISELIKSQEWYSQIQPVNSLVVPHVLIFDVRYNACDYVDYIKNKVLCDDDIYKGENSDEDISSWSEDAIWNHLKNKIYDSTLTIVLISPNMKETGKWQRSQWIPWEISFSVRETTRNNRTSHRNALLGVILPDKSGSYDYYNKNNLFPILKSNIENGYAYVVTWDDFLSYPQVDMNIAFDHKDSTPSYKIVKSV